jgi:hypothetical protein
LKISWLFLRYNPLDYGQYTDDAGRIFTIVDPTVLDGAYFEGLLRPTYNATLLSWSVRQGELSGDLESATRWLGTSFGIKVNECVCLCVLCAKHHFISAD